VTTLTTGPTSRGESRPLRDGVANGAAIPQKVRGRWGRKQSANWPEMRGTSLPKPGRQPCDDICTHPRDGKQRMLTVHHLDMNKVNVADWNLAALCQGCHLSIQGRVDFEQGYMLSHSDWMRPHVEGFLEAQR